jgi:hypothetical protein
MVVISAINTIHKYIVLIFSTLSVHLCQIDKTQYINNIHRRPRKTKCTKQIYA